jgi:hypothetical protein
MMNRIDDKIDKHLVNEGSSLNTKKYENIFDKTFNDLYSDVRKYGSSVGVENDIMNDIRKMLVKTQDEVDEMMRKLYLYMKDFKKLEQ